MKKKYLLFKIVQWALISLGWVGIIFGAVYLASKNQTLGLELLIPGFAIYLLSYFIGYFYLDYRPKNDRIFDLFQILRLLAECLGFTGLAVGVICFFLKDPFLGLYFSLPGTILFIISFVFERYYSDN